jgi:hypothetical protein
MPSLWSSHTTNVTHLGAAVLVGAGVAYLFFSTDVQASQLRRGGGAKRRRGGNNKTQDTAKHDVKLKAKRTDEVDSLTQATSVRYLDEFVSDLKCSGLILSMGIFPDAKEITESMVDAISTSC